LRPTITPTPIKYRFIEDEYDSDEYITRMERKEILEIENI